MPELPEVETIARTLAASILGARVGSVWTSGLPLRLARPLDVGALRRAAAGRTLAAVRRKGKYLLLDFEGGPRSARGPAGARAGVLVHLGMSGRLLVDPAATTRPPHTHVVFTLDGGRELRFRDPRRFGWLTAGTPIDAVDELALLGPDPLTELDETELATRLDGVRAPIKAFLLDQRRVAGLGNIYVSEALFRARIHPTTPAGRVRGRARELLRGVREALEVGIANRGTTLRDFVDAEGRSGDNQAALLVYGRAGEPCRVCGTLIRRRVDAARSTFFCARCQKR